MNFTWMKVLVVGVFLVVGASYVYTSDWFQKKYAYPFLYNELVCKYASEHQLDPWLVTGVIKAESKFLLEAKSPVGAVGLMQLMPETAQWIAEQSECPGFQLQDLASPEVNIRFGTWYLASLKHEFHENEILMLAAYNAGRGNVKQWMEQYGWTMQFRDVEQIPFPETREFIREVLWNKKRYQELYNR